MSVTVTNTGAVAVPITSITYSTSGPQPFSQTNNCGSSVAVGAKCTISVVFDPASVGSAAATLSVNAGNGAGTQTVALSGTGIAATYTALPSSLAFGNETTNVASAPKSVTVTNTGTAALPITSITLSTSGTQPFSQTNNCGTLGRGGRELHHQRGVQSGLGGIGHGDPECQRRQWRGDADRGAQRNRYRGDLHGIAELSGIRQ